MSYTFMIMIQHWSLTSRSNLLGLWYGFVFKPQFLVLWNSHIIFDTRVYHHGTMCHVYSWPLYDLDLWPQYQTNIFTINLSLARWSLLFDIGILNFGIWVYHHNTTSCVHSWLLYELDLWPICGWLSWRLKCAFLIKICPLFVVVVVVLNFSHFHLLLQNHWANFKQTYHNASLGEGDSSLLNEGPALFQGKIIVKYQKYIAKFYTVYTRL